MYKLIATKDFLKNLKKLDKSTQKLIKKYIDNNLLNCDNPKAKGKPLQHNLTGYWRYRIGDYRLICEINENEIIIILIDMGYQKIYT